MTGLSLLSEAEAGRGFSLARLRFQTQLVDGTYHVAIAGSNDFRDWWRNFSTDLVEWPREGPGLVHLGFWEGAEILFRSIWVRSRGHRVRLYGYSLGGAIALCLGLALRESGRDVESVITYGAPKVGDSTWCESYPIPVTSFRCGVDPVPHLPWLGRELRSDETRGGLRRYRHVSQPIQLPSPRGWRKHLPLCWHLDHQFSAYVHALKGPNNEHQTT